MNNNHKPEAYINGYTRFHGINLTIDERVFVPNQETELLVATVLEYMDKHPAKQKLIDVGTGSGNIAIALASKYNHWSIIGTDLSQDALAVAKMNVESAHLTNIKLVHTDLIAEIDEEPAVIVCNLPWGREEYMLKSNSVEALSYMPSIAIYPVNGIIGAYLNLCGQILRKGWNTIVFAEVGRIPEHIIRDEMPVKYDWMYKSITNDYAVLIINFKK